jgi:MoxR-like ATPase
MKLLIGYPSPSDERAILTIDGTSAADLSSVLELSDVVELQKEAESAVQVNDLVSEYIIRLVNATRQNDLLVLGASPRGSIALYKTAKALALINSRGFVTPDDVRELAVDVLAHRLILSPKGKSTLGTAAAIIEDIVKAVPIPV